MTTLQWWFAAWVTFSVVAGVWFARWLERQRRGEESEESGSDDWRAAD